MEAMLHSGKYFVGIDTARDDNETTCTCVFRRLFWWEKLLLWLRRKPIPPFIMVECAWGEKGDNPE